MITVSILRTAETRMIKVISNIHELHAYTSRQTTAVYICSTEFDSSESQPQPRSQVNLSIVIK